MSRSSDGSGGQKTSPPNIDEMMAFVVLFELKDRKSELKLSPQSFKGFESFVKRNGDFPSNLT